VRVFPLFLQQTQVPVQPVLSPTCVTFRFHFRLADRAIAPTLRCRFFTVDVQVHSQGSPLKFVVDKMTLGQLVPYSPITALEMRDGTDQPALGSQMEIYRSLGRTHMNFVLLRKFDGFIVWYCHVIS
jgi:hypothetical protein